MGFKEVKQNKVIKFFTNSYVIILTTFLVWMMFFDENSYLNHRKFNKEIEELKKTNEFYKNKIEKDKEMIERLQDSLQLERFAREKYLMKKKNEDVYIIEFDSIKK